MIIMGVFAHTRRIRIGKLGGLEGGSGLGVGCRVCK